jgi:hypothetical protein
MVGAIGIRMPAGGFQSEVITATPAPEMVGVIICGRNEITEFLPSQENRLTPLEEVIGAGAFRAATFRVCAGWALNRPATDVGVALDPCQTILLDESSLFRFDSLAANGAGNGLRFPKEHRCLSAGDSATSADRSLR